LVRTRSLLVAVLRCPLPEACDTFHCCLQDERLYDEGHGTAWNVSPTGFRVSGTLPLQPGDVCSLKVKLPKQVSVLAGVVRWVQDDEFGIETRLMDTGVEARLAAYIRDRTQEL